MKRIKFSKKKLIWASASSVAIAAVVIPVAVVFSSKETSEETNPIEIIYGTDLVSAVNSAPKIEGYKTPTIDLSSTTYNETSNVNNINTKITFVYEPDGSITNLTKKQITHSVIIKKAVIQTADVISSSLTSQQTLAKDAEPISLLKSTKVVKYSDWQVSNYKTLDGKTLSVSEIKNLNVSDKFIVSYNAIPDENHVANDGQLQTIVHTMTVVVSLAEIPVQNYKVGQSSSLPIVNLTQINGYSQWSEPTYTLDDLSEISEVTINFVPVPIAYTSRFSFFSELYFYDNQKNKIDYDVTEYTETKPGVTNGPTINDWALPSQDLWIIKKFLTDGKAGPKDTWNEIIDSKVISADRLYYEVRPRAGVNLVLSREDRSISNNYNRILVLDPYQTQINTQRLKVKFKTPQKLDSLTYYFGSLINSDLKFSFITKDGSVFTSHHSSLTASDGKDITEYSSRIRDALVDVEKTEKVTLNGELVDYFYWKDVWPINKGTITYRINDLNLQTLSDLNNLSVNTNFTATYKATKLPETDAGPDITYKIKYKVSQGESAPSPANTAPEQKTFLLNSTSLPADKTEDSAIGYLPWSMPVFTLVLDPKVKFTKISELRNLAINTKFYATYIAKKDPKYNATNDATYIVEYTVISA